MPHLKYHIEESLKLFGEPFEELHIWLDEFAGKPTYGMRHRHKRHHLAGIEEAVKLFSEVAREPARKHIISDLKEEGWTESDPFPKDENHYKSMGLF